MNAYEVAVKSCFVRRLCDSLTIVDYMMQRVWTAVYVHTHIIIHEFDLLLNGFKVRNGILVRVYLTTVFQATDGHLRIVFFVDRMCVRACIRVNCVCIS